MIRILLTTTKFLPYLQVFLQKGRHSKTSRSHHLLQSLLSAKYSCFICYFVMHAATSIYMKECICKNTQAYIWRNVYNACSSKYSCFICYFVMHAATSTYMKECICKHIHADKQTYYLPIWWHGKIQYSKTVTSKSCNLCFIKFSSVGKYDGKMPVLLII